MLTDPNNHFDAKSPSEERPRLLFVDDEKNILNALNRLFFNANYEILLANSAKEALDILNVLPVNVIVSDQRMPETTGVELLIQARDIQPNAIRIILTGYTDISAAQQAINQGAIYHFLTKPWNDEEFISVITRALDYYFLQAKNKQLYEENQRQNEELKALNENLNQRVKERTKAIFQKNQELADLNQKLSESFSKLVRLVVEIIEIKSLDLSSHSKRVAAAARYIAAEMNLPEDQLETIEIAGLLHDIGKISLPDQTITKRENLLTIEELNLWKKHSLIGERILGNIDRLTEVRRIVRHHHENYNGSGFPDGLRADEIPLGARIIAAADAYDKLVNKIYLNVDNTRTRALKAIRLKMGTELDPDVVTKMISFLQTPRPKGQTRREIELRPFELKENMILSRDLYTTRGSMVFQKDKRLDPASIKTILDSERLEKLLTSVYVYD